MSRIFIVDLKEGQRINQVFLVINKKKKLTKHNKPYYIFTFKDKTGILDGYLFSDKFDGIMDNRLPAADDFVKVEGNIDIWEGRINLKIDKMKVINEDEVNLNNFIPVSSFSAEELLKEIRGYIDKITDVNIRNLLNTFLNDAEFVDKFKKAPAAKINHHAYRGGLMEHYVFLFRLAERLCDIYSEINRDILYGGIFLHDVGKIEELSYKRGFDITDKGVLLHHITIGVLMLQERARGIENFPEDLLTNLLHIILSHHGRQEWGSPVLPRTVESLVLHHIDQIDSSLNTIKNAKQEVSSGGKIWTEKIWSFDKRQFFLKGLDDED